ncbi:ABC transporter permease [soil metagenome]
MTALWNPIPVFMLTVRQFVGGKAVRVVTLIALLPVLFAIIFALSSSDTDGQNFIGVVIFEAMFIATLLPICVLILATGAIGNEIEDQTLPYLTLKPISRLRIVFEKLFATVVTAVPPIGSGLILAYLLVFRSTALDAENLPFLWPMLASAFAGIVAYSAVFLLVSLFINRALLAGITYALLWESLLGRYLPGLRVVSIRHYTESIYVGLLSEPRYRSVVAVGDGLDNPDTAMVSVIVLSVVSLAAALLSVWRLRNLNLE